MTISVVVVSTDVSSLFVAGDMFGMVEDTVGRFSCDIVDMLGNDTVAMFGNVNVGSVVDDTVADDIVGSLVDGRFRVVMLDDVIVGSFLNGTSDVVVCKVGVERKSLRFLLTMLSFWNIF